MSTPPTHESHAEAAAARDRCLAHAEQVLAAAKALEVATPRIAYVLAVLAMEEIGKAELQMLKQPHGVPNEAAIASRAASYETDHEEKLFWAFFSARSGIGLPKVGEFKDARSLAKRFHELRMKAAYEDLAGPAPSIDWATHATEAVKLALARLGYSRATAFAERSSEEVGEIAWLLEQLSDDGFRAFASQVPQAEGTPYHQQIARIKEAWDAYREVNRAAVERELAQNPLELDGNSSPKWKLDVRFESGYHTIEPGVLKKAAFKGSIIELLPITGNKKAILARIELTKAVHVSSVWDAAHYVARSLLLALNIGAMGIFWWRVSKHQGRFYESLQDVEENAAVKLERKGKWDVEWGRPDTLSRNAIAHVAMVWAFLIREYPPGQLNELQSYENATASWALNDVNINLAPTAFQYYLECFQYLMKRYGKWDGKSTVEAVEGFFSNKIPLSPEERHLLLQHVAMFDQGKIAVDVGMRFGSFIKVACDGILLRAAQDHFTSIGEAAFDAGEVPPPV